MTNPQTEARAIALKHGGYEDGTCGYIELEKAIVTALAAKDVELAAERISRTFWEDRENEAVKRAERAEAQLAEANKALERIEATAKDRTEKTWYRLKAIADEARYAREQGGENNG